MKLEIYLSSEINDFDVESISILCLINYCQLKNENISVYLCFDTFHKTHFDYLNTKYDGHFEFISNNQIVEFCENKKVLRISCKQFLDVCDLIKNVSLPCVSLIDDHGNLIIYSGLAAIYRIIINQTAKIRNDENYYNLLGYKNACLKACKEVSYWTNLCEYKSIELFKKIISSKLSQYEIFQELKTDFLDVLEAILQKPLCLANKKEHYSELKYLEDTKMNISDLLIFFSLNLIMQQINLYNSMNTSYKNIMKWYTHTMPSNKDLSKFELILNIYKSSIKTIITVDNYFQNNQSIMEPNFAQSNKSNWTIEDLKKSLDVLQLTIKNLFNIDVPLPLHQFYNEVEIKLDWNSIEQQLNPKSGKLPEKRLLKKCQQLENLLFLIKMILEEQHKKKEFIVVDFCSGGGHLGLLVASFYPFVKVILIDNKEESLLLASRRIAELKLSNIFVYKSNLEKFVGKFDLGVALHACGSSTDLIIQKCIINQANLILSPCCYGSIRYDLKIQYPLSESFRESMKNLNITHENLIKNADRTEMNQKYEKLAYVCMELIDTDRILYLKQKGYKKAFLSRLVPETCSLKNNIIVALY